MHFFKEFFEKTFFVFYFKGSAIFGIVFYGTRILPVINDRYIQIVFMYNYNT